MKSEQRGMSFMVFVGFLLLFLFFLFLGPNEKSGNAIIGSTALGESPSMVTLIILFVILIIILAAVFVIFKRIKKKKMQVGAPKPGEKIVSNKGKKGLEMGEEEVEKLFSEDIEEEPEIKKEEPLMDMGSPLEKKEEEPLDNLNKKSKEPLTNLQEVKDRVKGMLGQSFSKDQITADLKSEGMSMEQINKILNDVNMDNLRDYVNQALKKGLTKDQVFRNLLAHGWKQEQISKVI